jgi:hypothetical protein
MNRADLITQICTGVDMSEQEDQDACGLFLSQNAKLVWGRAMWKDSVAQFTSTIGDAGAGMTTALWLPSRATFLCPAMVDRVLACRLDSRYLNIEDQGVYFRFDMEVFDVQGIPSQFHLLSPCVWEWDTAVAVRLEASEQDPSLSAVVDYLSTDNFTVTRATVAGTDFGQDFATTLRIDAMTKQVTDGSAIIVDDTNEEEVFAVGASDTAAALRQRIRLVKIPTGNNTLRVLAKVVMPTFTADADNPPIRGSEDVLIALTQADMYQREHQVGKAEAKKQEAAGHYESLFRLETVQQAHNKRLIPDDGFGETNMGVGAGWDWDYVTSSKI